MLYTFNVLIYHNDVIMSPSLWERHIDLLWFAVSWRRRRHHWCCRHTKSVTLYGQDSKALGPGLSNLHIPGYTFCILEATLAEETSVLLWKSSRSYFFSF